MPHLRTLNPRMWRKSPRNFQIASENNITSSSQLDVEFHGPIPPPDTLAKYQNIDPEIPRQIMAMARDRQHYVQNANMRDQETRNTLRQRGQWLSFIVAIVSLLGGIGLGAWFVAIGHIWPGMVLSVVSLINTALIFVKGEILFRFFDGKNGKK